MSSDVTVESLEAQIDGLVSAYQVMLNSDVAKEHDRSERFMGLLSQLRRVEDKDPRKHEVLVDLLHTTLFWLAEAKDRMEGTDGQRRTGS